MEPCFVLKQGFVIGIILLFVGSCVHPSGGDVLVSKDTANVSITDPPPDEEWNRTYYIPSERYAEGNCIQVTPDSGYIVTGDAGYGYWHDVYLLRVDNQGNELWNRTYGNQNIDRYDRGNWVEVTSDQGYIIVGNNCRIYSKEQQTESLQQNDDVFVNDLTHRRYAQWYGSADERNAGSLSTGREDQQIYGFDNMYPARSIWFNSTTPASLHFIGYSTADWYICAGTWAHDTWYVCQYYGGLYTVDPTTGDMTFIGQTIPLNGLGYMDISGIMYGCDNTNLYRVDPGSGATTLVGPMNNAGIMIDMAADSFGNAYGVDSVDHNLYSIDLSTGAATIIGSTGVSFEYAGMGFDKANNILYLSAYTSMGELYSLDLSTGQATLIGPFQYGDEVEGLAIPYDGVWYQYDRKVWLIKTDANGHEEWNKTFAFNEGFGHAIGTCVKQTRDGGYIITGSDAGCLLLLKTDGVGNLLWNRTYYGPYTTGISLALTLDGGYIVTGQNWYRLLLMKTDENGSLEWEKEFFNNSWPGSSGNHVVQASDGGYLISGATFLDGEYNTDMLLMKTDENGTAQWVRTFGGTEWDWGSSVFETTDGDLILGGTRGLLPVDMTYRFWLIRTHFDGSVVWDQFYLPSQSAHCYCLQQTLDHSIIACGAVNVETEPQCVILKLRSDNQPPSPSTIDGPYWGVIEEEYSFSVLGMDAEGDLVYCTWDWGDGNTTGWLGPYPPNETIMLSHQWNQTGRFDIRVKLKDWFGHESQWSTPHEFNAGALTQAVLFGRYTNLSDTGNQILFEAQNIRIFSIVPFQFIHFTNGEMILLHEKPGSFHFFPHLRFVLGTGGVITFS
jgi:hypothetical protein